MTQSLEHGLLLYEKRHPSSKGLIQGSVVVLKNRDGSILAEAGGRQLYRDHAASYTDLNRVTNSLRQPGSAMKPLVYLAAFRAGMLNLDSAVPDELIGVPNGPNRDVKWAGTTNDFRDAFFVGSTYGPAGITIAVRIGFDDNRSLGAGETGFGRDHSAFNGTWTLVPVKSDFAGQPVIQTGTVTIRGRDDVIIVSRSFAYEGATETFFYKDMTAAESNSTIRSGKDLKSKTKWLQRRSRGRIRPNGRGF